MEFHYSMYVHHLGLHCILFRRFLVSKINVALQLTQLWLKKITTTTTTLSSKKPSKLVRRALLVVIAEAFDQFLYRCTESNSWLLYKYWQHCVSLFCRLYSFDFDFKAFDFVKYFKLFLKFLCDGVCNYFSFSIYWIILLCAFSALTLLVGWQEEHPACKNWVVGCWHGYLSGARCRLACVLADATATHCLLLQ